MQKTSRKKIVHKLKRLAISLSCFSLCICWSACYEQIEGCLDINSSNYLVSADRACDSCCVYPNLNLNVEQIFKGLDYNLGDTIINNLGNELVLTDYSIILSEFHLDANGVAYSVADSTLVNCGSTADYQLNDLIIIDNSTSFVTVGPWPYAGQYQEMGFLIGLSNCYHDAGNDDIQSGSRIASIDTLYSSGVGFRTMSFEFSDSLRIDFVGKTSTIASADLVTATNVAGNPMVLNMVIDFEQWLSEIDLSEDIQLTKNKLIDKAGLAITFSQ